MAPLPSGSYGRELRFTVLAPLIRVFLAFGVDQIFKAFRLEIFFPAENRRWGKRRKRGADKPTPVGPRGPVPGGGGGATSRREAALPKNEVPTSRLKTHPSALEHGKEWRTILLL